jgi:ribosomal protein S18 acetylase RimI-like enzyme
MTDVQSSIDIVRPSDAELHELFSLAKAVFSDEPLWNDGRVLNALLSDVVFAARERAQPAGYLALRTEGDAPFVIEQVLVAPGHERRGVGHRLLEHAEGYAISERASALQIVVERDNRPARSFYARSGFVPVEDELFELVLPRLH